MNEIISINHEYALAFNLKKYIYTSNKEKFWIGMQTINIYTVHLVKRHCFQTFNCIKNFHFCISKDLFSHSSKILQLHLMILL